MKNNISQKIDVGAITTSLRAIETEIKAIKEAVKQSGGELTKQVKLFQELVKRGGSMPYDAFRKFCLEKAGYDPRGYGGLFVGKDKKIVVVEINNTKNVAITSRGKEWLNQQGYVAEEENDFFVKTL